MIIARRFLSNARRGFSRGRGEGGGGGGGERRGEGTAIESIWRVAISIGRVARSTILKYHVSHLSPFIAEKRGKNITGDHAD